MTNRSRYAADDPAVHADSRASVSITAVPFPLAGWLVGVVTAVALALLPVAADAQCRTHKCWHRVSVKRHVRAAWRYYRAHPMPYCTWAYESGTWGSAWRLSRYRARNTQSTAGGKFQIIDRTWFAYGGRPNGDRYPAAVAPPLEQEKIARRILASQGRGAWARC